MESDPVVGLANTLADDAATYRLLFRQTLAALHRNQVELDKIESSRDALRAELARYTAAQVGA